MIENHRMTCRVIGLRGRFDWGCAVELNLVGKKTLILGGSRGVGRAIAIALASEGACVGIVARNAVEVANVVSEMGGEQAGHWGRAIDLMPEGASTELVDDIYRLGKQPDIIIHNLGGTLTERGPFCSIAAWRRVWRLNLEIAIEINSLLIPEMQKRKWGRVIHISSIAAVQNIGALPYCTAKAALNAYTRNLGCSVASDNVVVSAIMPGAIEYEGSFWAERRINEPQFVDDFLKNRIAVKRFATVREISEFAVFLASEQASFFVGAVLPIDGGTR